MTPLLSGRDFTRHDDIGAPIVAIVNEQLAKQLFGEVNVVGRVFRGEGEADQADPAYQIVGVVKNTKYNGLREEFRPIAFLPLAQDEDDLDRVTFMVRGHGQLGPVMAGVRQTMTELQDGLLVEFKVLDVQVQDSVLRERLMAKLSGGFGLLAALLSTLGLYGVMSYMVARRRNEIGVRMALGAQPGDVTRLMFGEAGRLIVAGLILGLGASFALSRYAESLLYGLKPNDATTLALGCALLAGTALIACLWPARRAAKLDPAIVLRDE
jgi:ABC-type antimicrobial peptide transport system permease subunit